MFPIDHDKNTAPGYEFVPSAFLAQFTVLWKMRTQHLGLNNHMYCKVKLNKTDLDLKSVHISNCTSKLKAVLANH